MWKWIREVWVGSELVEFESAFDLEESVARLKAATKRSVFSSMARTVAVGSVSRSGVSLQRVVPMVGNAFKPFFRGRFAEHRGRVVLRGRFTIHWAAKSFMAIWFGFVLLACFGMAVAVLSGRESPKVPDFIPFAMLFFGIALISLGRWFSRNDATWLSRVIQEALRDSHDPTGHQFNADPSSSGGATDSTTSTTIVAGFLVLMALVAWGGAFLGIPAMPTDTGGQAAAPVLVDMRSPQVAGLYGGLLLVLAYGVWRRRRLAWRAGFVLLIAGWAYSMVGLWEYGMGPFPAIFKALFSVAATIVSSVWVKWWYDQRVHFKP